MSELDEIMEGKHKINHLHIEGDTLAFETELDNYTWNLSPRDIEIIIYCLQNKIDQAIEYINKFESIKAYYEYIDEDGYDEYNYDDDFKKDILNILKGDNK